MNNILLEKDKVYGFCVDAWQVTDCSFILVLGLGDNEKKRG